jgi:hypothetical protein
VLTFLFVCLEICIQKILEKKRLEDGKHNEEFDEYNDPKPLAYGHRPEAVVVKAEDF